MDKALLISKAPVAVAIALTVGMLTSFALQGHRLWQQNDEILSRQENIAGTQVSQTVKHEPSDLVNGHLFGQPPAQSQPQAIQTENLPTTNLKLTLRGISASPAEESASALVEGPDQQTQVYVVGNKLPGDATLRAVYANRVVIERRGRLENLYFPEDSDSSSSSISSYPDDSSSNATDTDYQDYSQEQPYQPEPSVEQQNEQIQAPVDDSPSVDDSSANSSAPATGETYSPAEPSEATAPSGEPAYVLDALSEDRKQEIRERLQRLREQIINQ